LAQDQETRPSNQGAGTGLNNYRLLIVLLLAQLAASCVLSDTSKNPEASLPLEKDVDLADFFAGIDPNDATFVVYHPSSGQIIRHNAVRAQQRFIPASTYKIPNSLIALETEVAKDADHRIPWDSAVKPAKGFWSPEWSKDHTLRSAIGSSVYWYYQELARGIGPERMQKYLDHFDYGNRDMGGGIDQFWLHGDLRISPNEQVRFLERMYSGKLGLSPRTTQIVKEILVLEESADYRLSGKTGTADVTPTRELAWLVGFVERRGEAWFYALNMEGEQVWEQWGPPAKRLALVRSLLQDLKVLPHQG
jgi:beta-lactamase class D